MGVGPVSGEVAAAEAPKAEPKEKVEAQEREQVEAKQVERQMEEGKGEKVNEEA